MPTEWICIMQLKQKKSKCICKCVTILVYTDTSYRYSEMNGHGLKSSYVSKQLNAQS